MRSRLLFVKSLVPDEADDVALKRAGTFGLSWTYQTIEGERRNENKGWAC